jgi:ABC-type glycerol-3-phosphate transport system substrate-binding protein
MDVSFGYGFGGVDGFIISSGTAHPNEAWRWIEFLSRQEIEQQGQGPKGSQLGRIPARKSVAESTGYWQDIDAESAAAYQTALAAQVEVPSKTPDYTVFGPLSQALYEVMNGSKKPDAALKDAQKMLEEQIAQAAQLTPTPEADTSPVVVATPAPVVAPEGKTPIRFSLNGYQPGPLRRLAQSFNQQNPQYFVEIQNTQAMTEPLTLQQTATSSDCFSWWSTPQSETEFKALLDLQPFFDSDASFKRDDYPQAVLAPYQYNGGIYGLPYAFNVRSLNYNRTMFESAGVDAPLYSWTPENFLAAAKALTNGTGEQKQYGYVPFGGGIQSDMFFFVGQFGGKIALGSGKDAKLNFNDPKVIEAIQWYIDLAKVHGVMPEFTIPYRPNDQYEDRSYEIVQAGRAGMWFGYGGDAGPFMGEGSEMNWELGTAPLPIGQGGFRNGDLYTRGFYISASSQQAQGCWEWLKFLSNDTANLGSDIPARISIAESSEYIEKAAPAQVELYKAYAEALKKPSDISGGLDSLYTSTKYGIDMYWFYKAIDDTIKEDADLGKGLTEAQQKTTEHMACVVETEKPATCAKQVDPEYDGYNTQDPTDGPIPID